MCNAQRKDSRRTDLAVGVEQLGGAAFDEASLERFRRVEPKQVDVDVGECDV